MPPRQCGPHCVQVIISNPTQKPAEFQLRRPGQNWQGFTLYPRSASSFSWQTNANSQVPDELDARLDTDDEGATPLSPGTEYEIRTGADHRGGIFPKGEAGQ
jgi:hypothetical protein